MKKILTTPFVQFLFFGALIFLGYYLLNPTQKTEDTIIIDDNQFNRIISIFQKQWNRNPSEEELNDLLQARVNEEILYREALKMGLDKNDEIVKRRLSQKFEFLTTDMANLNEPSKDDIKKYYNENKEKYQVDPIFSYAQVYINIDKRNDVMNYARSVKKNIEGKEITPELLEENSDQFPIALYIEKVSKSEIITRMGDDFYDKIKTLEINKWSKPIQSSFGLHLIYPTEIIKVAEPDISTIYSVLKRDYLYEYQANINKTLLNEYKNNYTIKVVVSDSVIPQDIITKLERDGKK